MSERMRCPTCGHVIGQRVARQLLAEMGMEISREVPMPRANRLAERDKEMAALYAAGETLQKIGDKYGITREAVRLRIRSLGITHEDRKQAVLEERAALYTGFASPEQNATDGISPWMIRDAMRRLGRPVAHRKYDETPHGTRYAYTRMGCRCELCREAQRKGQAEGTARRANDVPERVHGTINGYRNYACRCERCRVAGSLANRLTRERRKARMAGVA